MRWGRFEKIWYENFIFELDVKPTTLLCALNLTRKFQLTALFCYLFRVIQRLKIDYWLCWSKSRDLKVEYNKLDSIRIYGYNQLKSFCLQIEWAQISIFDARLKTSEYADWDLTQITWKIIQNQKLSLSALNSLEDINDLNFSSETSTSVAKGSALIPTRKIPFFKVSKHPKARYLILQHAVATTSSMKRSPTKEQPRGIMISHEVKVFENRKKRSKTAKTFFFCHQIESANFLLSPSFFLPIA